MHQSVIDKFLRTVAQRHEDLKARLHELRNALVRPEDENKKLAAQRALTALGNLAQMFHEKDLPVWFADLTQFVGRVAGANDPAERGQAAEVLMQHLLSFRDPIFNQSLADQPLATGAPDIEGAYTTEYQASEIPLLFDELVAALEQVIASGELDSNKAINALQSLIALLKKHRNGTYSSAQWAWQFGTAAALNILYRYATNNAAIGPLIQGIEDTIKKADPEWGKVRGKAVEKLRPSFPAELPKIGSAPAPINISGPIHDAEFEVNEPKQPPA